jgi:bifunctional UDP-N-acetylglucosamine pyrophosphorylase / glucosamine-1-phosphate N-acetyltransferase
LGRKREIIIFNKISKVFFMYGAIILAAGDSKRMCSSLPKVLHSLAGEPVLLRIIKSVLASLDLQQIIVVGGANIELLKSCCENIVYKQRKIADHITWAHQEIPKGTADAVLAGTSKLSDNIQNVIIISGDLPLISADTLNKLQANTPSGAIGITTGYIDNAYGFGRIKRDQNNKFIKIIEESDSTAEEKQITEINVGLYLFPKEFLATELPTITNHNAQREYYLTDLLGHAVQKKILVTTTSPDNPLEIFSFNTRAQLIQLERAYQLQQARYWIDNGVTILDPGRIDIRGEVSISKDVEIDVNVILAGKILIESGVKIGANCYIKDTIIKANAVVCANSFIEGATIDPSVTIGPFARIRANTKIGSNSKIGNFVEIKASSIGENSKINHLSYVGDARIGNYVNIGAGSVTCNYDGANKHVTVIKDRVSVGACCQLIAPVTVAEDATLAAGTTLMQDAPADQLTLNKKIQYSFKWRKPTKTTKTPEPIG